MLHRIRRYFHASLLVSLIVLTLAFTIAAIIPIHLGPYPSGYRDRSVATFFVSSFNRRVEIYFLTHPFTPRSPVRTVGFHRAGQDIDFPTILYGWGFHYNHSDYINNSTGLVTIRGHDFTIPCWMLAIFFFAASLFLAIPLLRRLGNSPQDPLARLCPHCLYDLRASPTRCPECGRPIGATP